ncbi:MAG: 4-(cytidine 5'-diphospho)-2-C-methyl-D-erythritol kinase [Pseudomonadota bacterium]|nr:4-(cytidine 5'-diphospho)-2-C-methyl-D-erythritol kinase [Pseudomonadota bacterium]
MIRIEVLSPAKLNLNLKILNRRPDGYHNIQTIFQFIDFGDNMTFELTKDRGVQLISNEKIQNNLILKAADLIEEKLSQPLNCKITLNKKIPIGAGLGGGSSNAATTLLILNRLLHLNYSNDQLSKLGYQLGADVPIFLLGKNALAESIGEKLMPIATPECWFLIVYPRISVSTNEIFSHSELTRNSLPSKISAILKGHSENDCQNLVASLYPEISSVLTWLKDQGNPKLTGTGSCIFCQFETQEKANSVLKVLPNKWLGFVTKGISSSPVHKTIDRLEFGASPSG